MKKLVSLILIFLVTFTMYAAEGYDEFTIRAFKTGFEETNLVINDRTTQIDVPLEESGNIELNPILDRLLGSTSASADRLSAFVIFSYRIESNKADNFDLTVTLSELKRQMNQGETLGEKDTIKVLYQIGNFNEVFAGFASDGQGQSSTSPDGSTIKGPGNSSSHMPANQSLLADGQDASFTMQVETTSGTGANTTDRTWIARGAVGMIIDNTEYNNANPGQYMANATLTLQTR